MYLLLIAWELRGETSGDALLKTIRGWGAKPLLETLWVMKSNGSASSIRTGLQSLVSENDRIIVLEIKEGSGWGTFNASAQGQRMLMERLGDYELLL